jgi:hypothetical protein
MLTQLKSGFPHRLNDDGSHDSICIGCFETVATAQNEWELVAYESAHVCDAGGLYSLSQGLPQKAVRAV